jgi:hypothetical protein
MLNVVVFIITIYHLVLIVGVDQSIRGTEFQILKFVHLEEEAPKFLVCVVGTL